jgi:hypothetical protein
LGLLEEELGLCVEHNVVHRGLLYRLVEDAYPLHLFVAHEQDLRKQGCYLDILGPQLLEEINAGGVAAGGVEVLQQASCEVVRDNIWHLDDGVRPKLPTCPQLAIPWCHVHPLARFLTPKE